MTQVEAMELEGRGGRKPTDHIEVSISQVSDKLGRPATRLDVASDKYTCDTCNRRLSPDEGYLLTTKQVVLSVESWRRVFLKWLKWFKWTKWLRWKQNREDYLLELAFQRASSDTPWVICEGCSCMFSFDRQHARHTLKKYRQTGEFPKGQVVCTVSFPVGGGRIVVEPTDEQTWDAMLEAINAALVRSV